ncbi:hypothetical protein ACOMHN_038045 [Nucella lapillus]
MLQKDRWYETGSSAQVLYAAAGASDDFARGGAGVKYAFTIELSPSDFSQYGFLLPPRQISRVVEDHWPAFKAIALTIWERLNETNQLHHHRTTTTTTTNAAAAAAASPTTNSNHAGPELSTAAESRGSDSTTGSDGLTDVRIDGHTFRLNLSDPAVAEWMEYYVELLQYRSQYTG